MSKPATAHMPKQTLWVNEVFSSISGEVGTIPQGALTTFIRFQGCNLSCEYCDAPNAQKRPDTDLAYPISIEALFTKVIILGNVNVVLTGGEPFMQPRSALIAFYERLIAGGISNIQLETNGSIVPPTFLPICHVVDYKLPGSGMMRDMASYSDLLRFPKGSFLKFVCTGPNDFAVALQVKEAMDYLGSPFTYAFSATESWNAAALFEAMELEGLSNSILNVQVHKLIGLA